jgi:hypothetical protein
MSALSHSDETDDWKLLVEQFEANKKSKKTETGLKNPSQSETDVSVPVVSGSAVDHQRLNTAQASSKLQNLLMCTQAKVQFGSWPPMTAQVFLDSGSQRNLISSDFAHRIGSKPFKFEKVKMAGFDAIPKSKSTGVHHLKLHGFYGHDFQLELIELENIVGDISFVSNPYHPTAANEVLPASLLTRAAPDVLIGIKGYLNLAVSHKEVLPSGFARMHSLLGDLIAGEGKVTTTILNPDAYQITTSPVITLHDPVEEIIYPTWTILTDTAKEDTLDFEQRVTNFLLSPQIGLESQKEVDDAVHEEFLEKVRMKDGRYEVALPWKPEDQPQLQTNYGNAFGRFQSTLRLHSAHHL